MATLKVLVVDDEPGIRSGINRILQNFTVGYPFMDEDFDFTLIDAETGEEAIDIIEKNQVDIILLDKKVTDPIIAQVEGVSKFTGYAGLSKQSKAFQVDSLLYSNP